MPYLFGCDLYNHGYWWEAHEAWESLWLSCTHPVQRGYLQGLIQVANAHLKLEMGRHKAVRRLTEEYLGHLRPVAALGGTCMGNDVGRWLPRVQAYHGCVLRQGNPVHDPRQYPYLQLASDA